MGIISPSPSMPKQPGSSMPQNTAVGSGAKPVPSKVKIMTSDAHTDPHTLDRAPPGWLK